MPSHIELIHDKNSWQIDKISMHKDARVEITSNPLPARQYPAGCKKKRRGEGVRVCVYLGVVLG